MRVWQNSAMQYNAVQSQVNQINVMGMVMVMVMVMVM
jgi:hypothetical protein